MSSSEKVIRMGISPAAEATPGEGVRRPRVLDSELFTAYQSARELLRDAEAERERILESARAEREQVLADARREGREDGLAEVSELLLRARLAAGKELERAQAKLVPLLVRLTEVCVGRTVHSTPDLAVELLARAIEQLRHAQAVVVRVHPQALAELSSRRAELEALLGRAPDIALKADAGVDRFGCIVESELGVVDARLSTQLETLERVLREALEEPPR
jgi:type III secretion protein L